MTPGLRRLYVPEPVAATVGPGRVPVAIDRVAVEAIREEWLVADRWWTSQPLRRHYFELALADGSALVVFRCGFSGRWYRQRA